MKRIELGASVLKQALPWLFFSLVLGVYGQETIGGKVYDEETNEPLPGATISIKGTYTGAFSDMDGSFDLGAQDSYPLTLVFTYVGYATQEMVLEGPNNALTVHLAYGTSLNEVVVTSQLREQQLQEVPIAVSVFDNSRLDAKPIINNLDGILTEIPGLSGGNTPGASVYSIRGISSNIFHNSIESSVGIFTDGFFSGRLTAGNNEFFDIQRIEVLKGPQGTLFGRNTSAGAIAINTTSAQPYNDISLKGTLGNEGQQIADYVFNFALSDKFYVRLSGKYQQRDGLVTSIDANTGAEKELGKVDLLANRLGFFYAPSDTFTADLKISHTNSDRGGAPFVSTANNYITQGVPVPATDVTQGEFGVDPFTGEIYTIDLSQVYPIEQDRFSRTTVKDFHDEKDESENTTATLTLKKYIGDHMVFESLSAYNHNRLDFVVDFDQSPVPYAGFESIDEFDTYNQEFRLKGTSDKVDWLVALNGFYQDSDQWNNMISDDAQIDRFLALTSPTRYDESFNIIGRGYLGYEATPFKEETLHQSKIMSGSVFSDATFHLSEKLDLTAGFRVSYDKKELRYVAELASGRYQQEESIYIGDFENPFPTFENPAKQKNIQTLFEGLGAADNTVDNSWVAFQPRVNLSYKFSDRVMTYAGYSRGYKPGGFGYYRLPEVKPEYNNAYEMGLKTDFANGYGFYNLSVFYYDYKNLQVEELTGNVLAIQNVAESTSAGFEMEAAVNLTENVTIGGSFSYINAEYKDFKTTVSGEVPGTTVELDYSGNQPTFTPRTSVQFYGGFELPIKNFGNLFVETDYSWQSRVYFYQDNDPDFSADPYGLWNASGGVRGLANGKVDVTLFANNIADTDYILGARKGAVPFVAFPYVSRGLPFMAGVSVKLNNILDW